MYRVSRSLLVPEELGLRALRAIPRGTVLFPVSAPPATAMNDADMRMAPLRAARDAASLERALDDGLARYAHSRLSNCAEREGQVVVAAREVSAGTELTRRYGWHRWLVTLSGEGLLTACTLPGFAWHVARHAAATEQAWAAAVVPRLPAWLEAARSAEPSAPIALLWDRDTGSTVLRLGSQQLS
jgi:hypothetical protein